MERSSRFFLLLRDAPVATRRAVVLSTWVAQYPIVVALEPYVSAAVASISIVTVAVAALAFGMRAGVATSMATQLAYIPVFVVFTDLGGLGAVAIQSVPTALVLIATGLIVGKLTDLAEALRAAEAEQRNSKQQLHKEADRLEALLDAVPDTILHVDGDGRVLAHKISGQCLLYAERHCIRSGQLPGGIIGDWITNGLGALMNGEAGHLIETHDLPAETGLSGAVEIRYVKHGTEAMVSIRDITDRLAAEQRDRLAAIIDEKDRFLASISHELRTPVTGIYGFAVMMAENLDLEDEAATEIAQIIVEQSRDLGFLIEDLLVASRVDIGEVSIKPSDFAMSEVIEATLSSFPEHRIAISCPGVEQTVHADPLRVRQILRNLISNAIRYGGPDVAICAAYDDGRIRVSVEDNGHGIPDELRDVVFSSYSSAHERPGETDAVGIGLNVSRRLAELMDGTLEYRRLDDTTVFTLVLPVERSEVAADARSAQTP